MIDFFYSESRPKIFHLKDENELIKIRKLKSFWLYQAWFKDLKNHSHFLNEIIFIVVNVKYETGIQTSIFAFKVEKEELDYEHGHSWFVKKIFEKTKQTKYEKIDGEFDFS